jgi:transcriptional regulator with XRE-family HTH domain
MTTGFETEEKSKVHLGRNVGRIREIIGMKQIVLAEKTGMSQQNISKLEQSEEIAEETLDRLAKGLGVTPEFIKTFNEERTIYNIQTNTSNTFHDSSANSNQHYQPTYNNSSVDKLVEVLHQFMDLEKQRMEVLERRLEELEKRK